MIPKVLFLHVVEICSAFVNQLIVFKISTKLLIILLALDHGAKDFVLGGDKGIE